MTLQEARSYLTSKKVDRNNWPKDKDLIKIGQTKDKFYKILGQLSTPKTYVFDSFDLYEVDGIDGAKELIKVDLMKLKMLRNAEVESWKEDLKK